ncbi:hypothetical protein ACPPVO_32830 [Dactylosporangium sp. McL0621]|uniref:hypothetical protein n=1 Tax=Dactylosporangium sp. McL0621 TaxID=3415678 RepID=UPI003CF75BA4
MSVSPGKTVEYGRSIRQESVTRWPIVATDIAAALRAYGDDSLTDQVKKLRVVHVRLRGGLLPELRYRPETDWRVWQGPPDHMRLDPPWAGYLNLAVVDDVIVHVEVLYRSPLC